MSSLVLGTNPKMGMNGQNLEWNRTPPYADTDAQLLLMANAGVKILRLPFYTYLTVPNAEQVYTLTTMDYVVNKALSYNMQILALMAFHTSANWCNGGHGSISSWPVLPAYYAEWCADIAIHYGSEINLYEMGNEPDISAFWQPAPDPTAYTTAIKLAYPAIKAANPNATVLSAGLTGIQDGRSTTFLTNMYSAGAKGYFDGMGLHLYVGGSSNSVSFATYDACRTILNSNGDNSKKIYVTEIGYYTGTATGASSESFQTDQIRDLYGDVLTGSYTDTPLLVWYQAEDAGTSLSNSEQNYGIFHSPSYTYPYLPKPSYYAYRNLAGMTSPLPTAFTNAVPNVLGLYYDDFNRANGAIGNLSTGQTWVGSTWTVNSNTAKNSQQLGSELVTNGGFDTDTTGWTAVNASLSSVSAGFTGNSLQVTNVGANLGYAYQAITTVVDQWYLVNINYKNGTAGSIIKVGTSAGDTSYYTTNSSSVPWTGRAVSFKATTTTTYISVGTNTATDGLTSFADSVSLKNQTLSKIMATVATSLNNVDASVIIGYVQASFNGLAINLDDTSNPQNFVLVLQCNTDSTLRIIKCVAGAYTQVFSTFISIAQNAKLEVVKNNTSYQLYYNGVAKGAAQTISDISIIANTIHGMFLPDSQANMDTFNLNSA